MPERKPASPVRPWTFAETLLQERKTLGLATGGKSAGAPDDLPTATVNPPALGEVVSAIHAADKPAPQRAAAALCFSGGGIRSATFGLGVLQALAKSRVLPCFHYLSTVSGGGYLGSWLSAWLRREKSADVVFNSLAGDGPKSPERPEAPQLEHLRRYSNYLAPRLSLSSADTWALAGIFVRNLALNWLVLLPVLFLVMLLPRFFIAGVQTHGGPDSITGACIAAFIALFVSSWYSAVDLPSNGGRSGTDARYVLWRVVPLLLAAHALALVWAWIGNSWPVSHDVEMLAKAPDAFWQVYHDDAVFAVPGGRPATTPLPEVPWGICALIVAAPIALGSLFGWGWAHWRRGADAGEEKAGRFLRGLWRVVAMFIAAGVGVIGIRFFATKVFPIPGWNVIHYTAFAPSFTLAIFLVSNFLITGLGSHASSEADREWWGRGSGWLLAAALGFALQGTIVFLGPIWLSKLQSFLTSGAILTYLGGVSGVLGVLAALFGASEKSSAQPGQQSLAARLLPLGSVLFVLLIGMFFSLLVDTYVGASYTLTFDRDGRGPMDWLRAIASSSAIFAIVMSCFVNVNRFSMHMMYRNRLVRAYLGASRPENERKPHRFTGFDEEDDLRLHELGTQRPLHIVNITLNLVASDNLAWQERKAQSFTASALHCGAWQLENLQRQPGSYQPSNTYGGTQGLRLGTAFTISGAAASPNSGYHSSAIVALLMTLFNLRLGWWLPNPGPRGAERWRQSGPDFALTPLLAEALGQTSEKRGFVNLSDGGHFDNMGLYEMLLRRVHYIVVVDGEQDAVYGFEGLSESLRKSRIDLGIEVQIDLSRIKNTPPKCCAVGRIHYSAIDGDDALDGWLLYVKPVITGTEPADVRHYSEQHPEFPNESTGDQFFSESQFESYRALGRHLGGHFGITNEPADLPTLFAAAADYAQSLAPADLAALKAEARTADSRAT